MGGDPDYLTPKKIGKWLKSKGRGKLYNYCVVCKRQFRIAGNGFKAHCLSQSHIQKVMEFAANPEKYLTQYSNEFKQQYLAVLAHGFTNKGWVSAKQVYGIMTKEVHHTHLSATRWYSLEEFLQDLKKDGIVKVEHQERGWMVRLDRSSTDEELDEKKRIVKEKQKLTDEERTMKLIEQQMKAAQELEEKRKQQELEEKKEEKIEEKKEDKVEDLQIQLVLKPVSNVLLQTEQKEEEKETESKKRKLESSSTEKSSKKSKADCWLMKDIVVKCYDKRIENGKYYKQKGVITQVYQDTLEAQVEMFDTGKKITVKQSKLETVIPKIGGTVVILKGEQKGKLAKLLKIHEKEFCGSVECDTQVFKLPYEDFSKYAK